MSCSLKTKSRLLWTTSHITHTILIIPTIPTSHITHTTHTTQAIDIARELGAENGFKVTESAVFKYFYAF